MVGCLKPAPQDTPPPVTIDLQLRNAAGRDVIHTAVLDIGSPVSFVSRRLLSELQLPLCRTWETFHSANSQPFTVTAMARIAYGLPGERQPADVFFYVADNLAYDLLVGRSELQQLPVSLSVDGKPIFQGFKRQEPVQLSPQLPVGEGIHFKGGTQSQQSQIRDLLTKYRRAVFEWSGRLGLFKDHVARLRVTDTTPMAAPSFRVGNDKMQAFDHEINDYLKRQYIEPAKSAYASPSFLTSKKALPGQPQRWRLVTDFRALNKKLEQEQYPVPSVQELLDAIGAKARWFITLDMTAGYHHCPLSVDSRHLTAFMTPLGQFQYKVLPFGLSVAPQIFQRTLETVLRRHNRKRCLVYLDDIIVFGETFEDLYNNFSLVLHDLAEAGGSIGLKKCVFLADEVHYLGHIVGHGGVKPTNESVAAVNNYPQPLTGKQLQRFIGLATWLRQHVPHFAELEARLRSIMPAAPNQSLHWTPTALAAFQELKAAIADRRHLALFDGRAKHVVLADASARALGAVLLQDSGNGPQPLEFASRVLTETESRYSNSERELLALVWAVTKKFRPYVEGRTFKLGTDHQALLGRHRVQPHTARLARLALKLEPYNFELVHVPGASMVIADALSRAVVASVQEVTAPDPPISEQMDLIRQCHLELGHSGWKVTYQALRQRVAWKGLRQRTWQAVLGCPVCARYNVPTATVGGQLQPIKSSRVHQYLVVDIVGPMVPDALGQRFAVVAIDHFSRWAAVRMIRRPTAKAAIAVLKDLFSQLGAWETLVSDPATQFKSRAFRHFLTVKGISQHLGSPQNYHATGVVERLTRTLKSIAAKLRGTNVSAASLLSAVQAYNKAPHSALGCSPFEAFFSLPPKLQLDCRQHWRPVEVPEKQQQQHRELYVRRWSARVNRHRPFIHAGDIVLYYPPVSTRQQHAADRHLRIRAHGPFRVQRLLPFNRVLVSKMSLPSLSVLPRSSSALSRRQSGLLRTLPIAHLRPTARFSLGGELAQRTDDGREV